MPQCPNISMDGLVTCQEPAKWPTNQVAIPVLIASGTKNDSQNLRNPLPDFFRVINEDARRRHLYAITIEDGDMVLWYLSRSQCVKSTAFSMVERTDLLVRVLVWLISATDEELGYDPLVTLLPDGTYVYELPPDEGRKDSLYYQTVELVSEFHSDDPVGRSARVWKVKQVTSPTDLNRVPGTSDRILKDVSLDARMEPEVEIQRQLFADIDDFGKRADWRTAGVLKEMREEDVETLSDALDGENFKRYFSCIVASHVSKAYSSPVLALSDSNKSCIPKRRCLYLYEFICTALHDIPTLGEAIDILKQCLTTMRLMYCAGWIHRDISVGNILAVQKGPEAPWEVKLSDLEFARKFSGPGAHEGEKPMSGIPFVPEDDQRVDSENECENVQPAWHEPDGPLLHNFQHDLESLWWILLWLVTARVRVSTSREWSDHFFKHSTDSRHGETRCTLLVNTKPLDSFALFPRDLPQCLYSHSSNFLLALNNFKLDLWRSYRRRYRANGLEDPGSYSWMMGKGASKFFRSIEKSRGAWASVQLTVETELRALRRAASKAPLSNKRKVAANAVNWAQPDEQHEATQPRKRLRLTAPDESTTRPEQRSRPVTRSMTRAQRAGPTTRSMTRRLQQSVTGPSRPTQSSNRRPRP
ncbi:other/FunK1 protein kinase [Coprinopsis cinerea AmutBmut pab1-1]|nr:other/FunK1 protein kinase [Coprinopsis cinerea AmutBmut pab1-1]